MMTVTPMKDNARKEALLKSTNVPLSGGNVLVLKDNEQELGCMILEIAHSTLRMQKLHLEHGSLDFLEEQTYMQLDFLLRCAALYGANHGAVHIENHIKPLQDFWLTQGFSMERGVCTMPIHRIVHTCKPNQP